MTPHVDQTFPEHPGHLASLSWVVEQGLCSRDDDRFAASIEGLKALARADGALLLRMGAILAWIKRQDVMDLGYSSFRAFLCERVDLSDSYLRGLIRLVESDLDRVKRALCARLIPIRVAIRAPSEAVDEAAWLAEHVFGDDELPRRERRVDAFPLGEEEALVVQKARRLARLLLGREVTDRQVDAQIVAWWREKVPADVLLAGARAPGEKPPEAQPLDWSWMADDPAEVLLGPWVEPASLKEAIGRLDEVVAMRRGRHVVLSKAYAFMKHERIYECAGYQSADQFVREVFDVSPRTARRWFKAGWTLAWYPEVEQAVREGLPLDCVAAFSDPRYARLSVRRWLAVSQRVGKKELARATKDALGDAKVVARYERAIELADAWDARRPSVGTPGEAASEAAAPLRVALPWGEAEPGERRPVWGSAEVVEGSRWLVETVRIPPQRGCGKAKKRDAHRCTNPECRRRTLRLHIHHLLERSKGGSDDPDNLAGACPSCHLRGVHTGRIGVEPVVVGGFQALYWTFPDGRRVLSFREVPM